MIDNKIINGDFTTFINEEKNSHELKISIKMMKGQRSDK